jgi:hypothetical protein
MARCYKSPASVGFLGRIARGEGVMGAGSYE